MALFGECLELLLLPLIEREDVVCVTNCWLLPPLEPADSKVQATIHAVRGHEDRLSVVADDLRDICFCVEGVKKHGMYTVSHDLFPQSLL